jgi:hypothetical protein
MNRYLFVMFLYAFSPIFLSTNLFAAGWHCAVASGPPNSGRYVLGQNPGKSSRRAAVAAGMAWCESKPVRDQVGPTSCRILACWVQTIGDPFCSVVVARGYHIPQCG